MAILHNRTTGAVLTYRLDLARRNALRSTSSATPQRAETGEGLWSERCEASAVHGTRAPADLIFLDRDLRVVRVVHAVPSGRPCVWCRTATSVLEMRPGFLASCDLLVGDELAFEAARSA